MPSIKFPTVDLTKFDLTKFDVRKFDLPKVDLPKVDTAKLTAAVRDAGYIAVGLGATFVERAQSRSEQFSVAVNDGLEQVRGLLRNAA
jgi:hypothetical protein